MAAIPLANELAGLSMSSKHVSGTPPGTSITKRSREYESPEIFASELRPLCPNWPQRFIKECRRQPARQPSDIAQLKVQKFKLASKKRATVPVDFKGLAKPKGFDKRQSQAMNSRKQFIQGPEFLKTLQAKKVIEPEQRQSTTDGRDAIERLPTTPNVPASQPFSPMDLD